MMISDKCAEIDRHAAAMQVKLDKHAPEWGDSWRCMDVDFLLLRLEDEVHELRACVQAGGDGVRGEAADVSNFAMFIAENVCRLALIRSAYPTVELMMEQDATDRVLRRTTEASDDEIARKRKKKLSLMRVVGQALLEARDFDAAFDEVRKLLGPDDAKPRKMYFDSVDDPHEGMGGLIDQMSRRDDDGSGEPAREPAEFCPLCGGSGEWHGDLCTVCNGKWTVEEETELEGDVPLVSGWQSHVRREPVEGDGSGESAEEVGRRIVSRVRASETVDERIRRSVDALTEEIRKADVPLAKSVVPDGGYQIRFAGSGPDLTFVEIEDRTGRSISIGRWEEDGEYQLLVVENLEGPTLDAEKVRQSRCVYPERRKPKR